MFRFGKTISAALIAGALLGVSVAGCQKQEGSAEQAGKEVDEAIDKAGEQVEKAGEAIQDAAKDAKEKIDR